jgi:indole-3-acetate monooxygenase
MTTPTTADVGHGSKPPAAEIDRFRDRLMHFEADKTLMDAAREIGPLIRKHADEAERERRLSKPVLKALKETGLLKMATPKSLGGLEADPITRALVVEEVGRHDSAAAWTLENPIDWAFFCARLPDEGAEEIYAKGADVLIAGQLGRPLAARAVDGGYNVSGRAPFVSNCLDADWISCTAVVDAEKHPDREPETRMVYFPVDKCKVIDNWHVMGMRGTGSHDIEVTDLFIPKARSYPVEPEYERGSHYKGPLYQLPTVGYAGTGIPTPMLGVARRALDEVTELALMKNLTATSILLSERSSAQIHLGQAEAILRSGRLLLLHTVSEAWQRCLAGAPHSANQKADLLLGAAHAMASAVRATDLACRIAGTTSIRTSSPLERCFRDIQTLRHHMFVSEARYGTFGQVYLGVAPDFAPVSFD